MKSFLHCIISGKFDSLESVLLGMEALLEKIHHLKIVIIGDLMLDHYIWGDTTRISPEAPVPVVHVNRDSYKAGGAANVALNITSLGAKAELCGWLGQDEAGERLRHITEEAGVTFDPFFIKRGLPTIVKTRVMVRNQQLCRLDREDLPQEYVMTDPAMIEFLKQRMDGVNAVILSDYAKGVIDQTLSDALMGHAKERGIFVAKDPKPRRQLALTGASLMTPNRTEALELADINLLPGQTFPADEVCARIWDKYRPENLVITLGGEGMLLSKEGDYLKIIPTYAREVFDVSGAGDTVIAALTVALAAGADLEEAAHFANTAAGIVVGKVGTATATPAEILNYHP